jgi:hypothetical protein
MSGHSDNRFDHPDDEPHPASDLDARGNRNGNPNRQPDSSPSDLNQILKRLADLRAENETLKELIRALQIQAQKCIELLERTIIPLSHENRQLREFDLDNYIVWPYAMRVIQIIDRQSAEITDAEQQVMEFSFVENCRSIDRAEHLELLYMLGIEPLSQRRGELRDTRTQQTGRIRPTSQSSKFGRVHRILRPGYWRRRDGAIVRPTLVEVWGPQAAVA